MVFSVRSGLAARRSPASSTLYSVHQRGGRGGVVGGRYYLFCYHYVRVVQCQSTRLNPHRGVELGTFGNTSFFRLVLSMALLMSLITS